MIDFQAPKTRSSSLYTAQSIFKILPSTLCIGKKILCQSEETISITNSVLFKKLPGISNLFKIIVNRLKRVVYNLYIMW